MGYHCVCGLPPWWRGREVRMEMWVSVWKIPYDFRGNGEEGGGREGGREGNQALPRSVLRTTS